MAALTLPCETKRVNLSTTAVTYAIKVVRRYRETSYQTFKVFAFGFETRIKAISLMVNRFISEALLCALLVVDHVSIRCCFSLTGFWWTCFCCRFQSVSPGSGALVSFSCSKVWKWMVYYYCDVLLLKQLLTDICQAVGDFCYACTRATAVTRLWTSHQTFSLPTDQTSIL